MRETAAFKKAAETTIVTRNSAYLKALDEKRILKQMKNISTQKA